MNENDKENGAHCRGLRLLLLALCVGLVIGAFGAGFGDSKTSIEKPVAVKISEILSAIEDYKPLNDKAKIEEISTHLAKYLGNRPVESISEAPMPGWYEVVMGDSIIYLSHDKRYILSGRVVDTTKSIDVTNVRLYEIAMSKKMAESSVVGASLKGATFDGPRESEHKAPKSTIIKVKKATGNALNNRKDQLTNSDMLDLRRSLKDAVQQRMSGQYGVDNARKRLLESSVGSTAKLLQKAKPANNGAKESSSQQKKSGNKIPKIGYNANGDEVSELQKREQVVRVYENLKENYTVDYPAKGEEKGALVVFSDYTCGYCKKLHRDISKLNGEGITVRYLFYPRHLSLGETSQAKNVMENMRRVWCSADQGAAMDYLYENNEVPNASCADLPEGSRGKDNPIREHFYLGQIFGLQGTPHSFTNTGKIIHGYSGYKAIMSKMGL